MLRLMVVLAGLAWGGGAAAQGQPAAPPGTPRRFEQPLAPLTDDWMRAVPQPQRQPLRTLHGLCTRWAAAPSVEAQQAIEQEARRAATAMGDQREWLGLVVTREINGNDGALSVAIANGVFLQTAGVGFLSMDTSDTRFARGSRDFEVLASVRRGDVIAYRVRVLRPLFGSGRCAYLARMSRLAM